MKKVISLTVILSLFLFTSCYPTYWRGVDSKNNKNEKAVVFRILCRIKSKCGLLLSVQNSEGVVVKKFIRVNFSEEEMDSSEDIAKVISLNENEVKISYKERNRIIYHTWSWKQNLPIKVIVPPQNIEQFRFLESSIYNN